MQHIQNYKALSNILNIWKFKPLDPVIFLGVPAVLKVFLGLPFSVVFFLLVGGIMLAWKLRSRPDDYHISLLRYLKLGKMLPITSIDEIPSYREKIGIHQQ